MFTFHNTFPEEQSTRLDDDWDRQVHVVRVDQAHREARVPCERAVHCALTQHLKKGKFTTYIFRCLVNTKFAFRSFY